MIIYVVIAVVLLAIGAVLIIVGRNKGGLKSEIGSMPTTSIKDLKDGQYAEIKGVASCDHPLRVPGSDMPSVYYSYEVKRHEHHTDSSGHTSSSWHTVDKGSSRVPFRLTDSTGTVVIDPQDAEFDAPKVVDRRMGPEEDLSQGVLRTAVKAATLLMGIDQKIEAHAVTTDRDLYVLGNVQRGPDNTPRIVKGDKKFFISTKSEEQLSGSLGRQSIIYYAIGGVLAVGAIVVLVAGLM